MKGHRYWVAVVFFILAAAPGFWYPSLTTALDESGLGPWKLWIFCVPPVAGLISPLVFGAQVDQRLQAQKALGWIMLLGSAFLFMAFHAAELQWGGGWFLFFFGVNAIISAPAWSLLNTITLSSLPDPGKSFGYFRVWGTIGWMLAGFTVSELGLDGSPATGKLASGIRIVAGVFCFLLPATLPKGIITGRWQDALGLGAIKLLKDRDLFIYYLTSFLFAIPLGALFYHTPIYLTDLGVDGTTGFMANAQLVEIVAMLGMGWVIAHYRVKTILVIAIFAGVLRYGFYATGSVNWTLIGVLLHGICWTFFFEAGKVFVHRRVEEGMRGQAQALLSFCTNGIGGVLGVMIPHFLHLQIQPNFGWSPYWLTLTGMNCVAMVIFIVGYRGLQSPPSRK